MQKENLIKLSLALLGRRLPARLHHLHKKVVPYPPYGLVLRDGNVRQVVVVTEVGG